MRESRFRGIGMTSSRTRERLVNRLREEGVSNEAVLERIRNVPRHLFVDEALASRAYEDVSLPIGHGQTISQPLIVARMTEMLLGAPRPGRVLEVGTGCGYQTAVLAPLVDSVYTVERIAPLSRKARQRLSELGIHNVRFRHGDGWRGWRANAPYDGILVTAAPPELPEVLLGQLADGGKLIIPVGAGDIQELVRVTRQDDRYSQEVLGKVRFVPMREGLSR